MILNKMHIQNCENFVYFKLLKSLNKKINRIQILMRRQEQHPQSKECDTPLNAILSLSQTPETSNLQ